MYSQILDEDDQPEYSDGDLSTIGDKNLLDRPHLPIFPDGQSHFWIHFFAFYNCGHKKITTNSPWEYKKLYFEVWTDFFYETVLMNGLKI